YEGSSSHTRGGSPRSHRELTSKSASRLKRDTQFWDALLKKCVACQTVCRQQHIISRLLARCKAMHAHYYDPLLKKCISCTKICGRHPFATACSSSQVSPLS
uniref:TACI cysteine-rich domain-containing protein n=1 Tax=Salarias fasciatus TaxID=181472 RepID=A0A672IJ66_SALFA